MSMHCEPGAFTRFGRGSDCYIATGWSSIPTSDCTFALGNALSFAVKKWR
jgi:hypothetical protein